MTVPNSYISQRDYVRLLLPFVLATATQPLLGAVDTAVAGHLHSPAHIAGVAVGAVIFNTIYWLLGFLRVGVTGFSAQAQAGGQPDEIWASFALPCLLAALLGGTIVLLQKPVFAAAMLVLKLETDARVVTAAYYGILVWAAPLVLINYVILGWLMGQARIRAALTMQMGGNALNIALDILLVLRGGFGVEGIALAACAGHIFSLLAGLYFLRPLLPRVDHVREKLLQLDDLWRMVRVNGNLLLRTICLLVQTNIFMASSASFGTLTLSANAILFQVMLCFSYVFEGIANTSSVLAGRAAGSHCPDMLTRVRHCTLLWTIGSALGMAALYLPLRTSLLALFTDLPDVLATAATYSLWGVLFPLCAGWGLTFYGLFTGASVTRPVFLSTLCALAAFVLAWAVAVPLWGNNGLWFAYTVFYLGRSVFLAPWWQFLRRAATFAPRPVTA
ncbi:MATE family efflux transporter [Desulfovibrio intestinalis]|uniref:MATE family multidrug resistance protein n=1 Tax=Desulfovibrio intestinalis TaxID=58621 RepID=A0A7W8C024_9BACT|nr:MATE family multidrug resistance protein [Desulfovibrio intestinalis]